MSQDPAKYPNYPQPMEDANSLQFAQTQNKAKNPGLRPDGTTYSLTFFRKGSLSDNQQNQLKPGEHYEAVKPLETIKQRFESYLRLLAATGNSIEGYSAKINGNVLTITAPNAKHLNAFRDQMLAQGMIKQPTAAAANTKQQQDSNWPPNPFLDSMRLRRDRSGT